MAVKIRREGEGIAEREFMGDPPTYDTFRDKVLVIQQTAETLIPKYEFPPYEWEALEDGAKRTIALAKKIFRQCKRLLKAIRDGNAEQIGWLAFELGELYEQLIIKCHWEAYALTGKAVVKGAASGGRRRGIHTERNRGMAAEYLRRKQNCGLKSDTALKAEIGREQGLGRSAAIAAINAAIKRGLPG